MNRANFTMMPRTEYRDDDPRPRRSLTMADGKTIEVGRTSPMGIVNHAMDKVETCIDMMELSEKAKREAIEVLRLVSSTARMEMIDSFQFMERKIGKMYLLYAKENKHGILPGARLDAEIIGKETERILREEEYVAIDEAVARRGEEALKRIQAIHGFVESARGAEKSKTEKAKASRLFRVFDSFRG